MTKKLTASQIADAKLALRQGWNLQDVVDSLGVTPAPVVRRTEVAEVPETAMITPDVREALKALPRVFGKVVVEERRELQDSEIGDIYAEYKNIRTIGDTLKQRQEVLKENIRTHIDVRAEREEGADQDHATDLDDSGHYLLPTKGNPVRVSIPNSNEQFSLEYRSGRAGTTSISSEALLDAYEAGDITREQYLSLTREKRVFDEEKASKAILADPSLLSVLRDASVRTGQTNPGTSLYLRKAK